MRNNLINVLVRFDKENAVFQGSREKGRPVLWRVVLLFSKRSLGGKKVRFDGGFGRPKNSLKGGIISKIRVDHLF